MFTVGQTVMHPGEGPCVVTAVRTEEFVKGQPREYYSLQPMGSGDAMTVFVPVDQQRLCLRPLMTVEQAHSLKASAAKAPPLWSSNERERQERFVQALRECDPVMLMRLVLDVREQQTQRRAEGKKLRFTDERALQEAVRLLKRELAVVLDVSKDDVSI